MLTFFVFLRRQLVIMLSVAVLSVGWQDITIAADITARDVTSALFKSTTETAPDLSNRDLSNLELSRLNFKGANLSKTNLFGADLSYSNLVATRLVGARLDRSTIMGADFSDADLSRASILRPNIFSRVEGRVDELPNFTRAKMIDANISGHLERIKFTGANLTRAVFGSKTPKNEELISPRLKMSGCDFTNANLVSANLSRNDVRFAKFVNATLVGANFTHSNLVGADFRGADVTDADFSDADVEGANFDGAIGIDRAKGLRLSAAQSDK